MLQSRPISGLIVLLVVGGCGGPSYKASPPPPISVATENESGEHSMPDMEGTGRYEISVEVYSDPERQKAIFDADLTTAGIIAMQLGIRNMTENTTRFRREDMTLVLPGGHHLSPMSAQSAARLIQEKTGRRIDPVELVLNLPFCVLSDLLCADGWDNTDPKREQASRAARSADYQDKELKDVQLPSAASTYGILFFKPPPGTAAFDEAELNIMFIPAAGIGGASVSRRVSGIGFIGIAPDATTTYVPRSRRGSKSCDSGTSPSQRWIGTWEAKAGETVLTISISDHAVTGRVVTSDGIYRLDGTVNANGEIKADIELSDIENSATIQGRFPLLTTSVDVSGAQQHRSLGGLAFHLCS